MSEKPRVVTERHFEYLAARAQQEDDFLVRLKIDAEAAGIPRIWISPACGETPRWVPGEMDGGDFIESMRQEQA